MKKFVKLLVVMAMVAVLACAFSTTSVAAGTVVTYGDVYQGEYATEKHDGFAQIIFGQVSDPTAEYGIIITDTNTFESYAFEGKAIGSDGKFGIAIYDMPLGTTYLVKAYSGNPEDGNYGETYSFYASEATGDVTNVFDISYIDNGDNTVTVNLSMKGDTVEFMGFDGYIEYSAVSDVAFVSGSSLWTGGSGMVNGNTDAGVIYLGYSGSVNTSAACPLLTFTLSYAEGVDCIDIEIVIDDIYNAAWDMPEWSQNGGIIYLG